VGTAFNLSYFGPPPSATNESLVGPVQLLKSGPIDLVKGTITVPLYLGHMKNGTNVWYILSDVSDPNVAALLGLNFSAKMTFMSNASRTANLDQNGDLVFDKGSVDFSPVRSITPGPVGQEFPPTAFQPGAVGDKDYSPFVQIVNAGGTIYNAPIVAFGVNANDIIFPNGNVDYSKVHDQVVAIDPLNMTVTINLINGFSFGKPIWYMSMDTSIPLGAAIEHNTFAPLMAAIHLGGDDTFSSPIERIFISTNGAQGCANPQRQGLSSDLADGFRPNNVVGGIPTNALDYSPAWDAAVRDWARVSGKVANAVRRTDDARIEILKQVFLDMGCKDEEAFVRARICYFHQVGYYALGVRESREERLRLMPLYTRVLTGRDS